jgi:hypothetical protein
VYVDSSMKSTTKASNRSLDQILPALMAFVVAIVTLLRSVKDIATKRLSDKNESEEQSSELYHDSFSKPEFRPPSPSPGFAESDLFPLVLQRLAELEEKVQTLQEKPSEMPCEKEELLNAAVRRVDALEAELIVTKKVIAYCTMACCSLFHLECRNHNLVTQTEFTSEFLYLYQF